MANSGLRDQKKEASWRQVILAYAGSAMSVRAWCRDRQVSEAGFYWWRRQLARRDAAQSSSAGHDELHHRRHDNQSVRLNNNQPPHPNLRHLVEDAPEDLHQNLGTPTARPTKRRSAPSPVFVPICIAEDDLNDRRSRIEPDDGSGLIEIVLTDGRCVRVSGSVDQRNLADVLTVLEHAAPGHAVMKRASLEHGSC